MSFTTFNDMLRRAAWRKPEQTFLFWTDRDRSLTYAQADALSDRVAGALASLGVQKGDRVGIFAHNGLDYVMAMCGAWKLGAISAHISVLQAAALADFVNDCTPTVLIYTGDMHHVIEQQRPQMPSVAHFICYDGPRDGAHDWTALLEAAPSPPEVAVQDMDAAHLSYTSGSSGKPKGAVLAHGFTARATHCIAERLGFSSADASLGPTSLASSYHLVANLLPGMQRAMSVGLMSRWNVEAAWADMERRGVTYLPANPPLLNDLLQLCRQKGRAPSRWRLALSGGAPLPPELKRAYYDELGVALVESYGQSELGGFVALGYPCREADERLAAIGPALPDKEVRIVDAHNRELRPGAAGEMVLRGGFMLGYWQMPEKSAEALRDGWLHTGDVGVMDAEGYLSLLGRRSEAIHVDGRVIFPRAIEEVLQRHPAVRHAAVIGVADAGMGEVPQAIVALYNEATATPAELIAYYRTQADADPALAALVVIPDMPMTPTGKIDKMTLKRRMS